jgi:hypothetical protein
MRQACHISEQKSSECSFRNKKSWTHTATIDSASSASLAMTYAELESTIALCLKTMRMCRFQESQSSLTTDASLAISLETSTRSTGIGLPSATLLTKVKIKLATRIEQKKNRGQLTKCSNRKKSEHKRCGSHYVNVIRVGNALVDKRASSLAEWDSRSRWKEDNELSLVCNSTH